LNLVTYRIGGTTSPFGTKVAAYSLNRNSLPPALTSRNPFEA
jgi:hypothetical protein